MLVETDPEMAGPISTGPEAESGSVDESDDGGEMTNVGVGLVVVVVVVFVVVAVVVVAGEVRIVEEEVKMVEREEEGGRKTVVRGGEVTDEGETKKE